MTQTRIAGLDVARAVALFGMFAAHVGDTGARTGGGGWPWLRIADGRSSALFTVLAGVSISLMLARRGGPRPSEADVAHTRVRVAVRAVLLIGIGALLTALGTVVDIILDNLGVMFLLALAALRWRPRVLLAVGVGFLAGGRVAIAAMLPTLTHVGLVNAPVVHELWSRHYPALVWVGYLLVGLAVGKATAVQAPSPRGAWPLAVGGFLLALIAYGSGWALSASGLGGAWTSIAPHSYTAFETLGNLGVCLAVLALCLATAKALPRLTWPLAAPGSMTLTLFSAQIVVIAVVGDEMYYTPSNVAFVVLCLASVVFACVWRPALGQGPLERLLSVASSAAARTPVPRSRPGAP